VAGEWSPASQKKAQNIALFSKSEFTIEIARCELGG